MSQTELLSGGGGRREGKRGLRSWEVKEPRGGVSGSETGELREGYPRRSVIMSPDFVNRIGSLCLCLALF